MLFTEKAVGDQRMTTTSAAEHRAADRLTGRRRWRNSVRSTRPQSVLWWRTPWRRCRSATTCKLCRQYWGRYVTTWRNLAGDRRLRNRGGVVDRGDAEASLRTL